MFVPTSSVLYSQNLLKAVDPMSLALICVHANPTLLRCRGLLNAGIAVVVFFPKGSEALGELTKYSFVPVGWFWNLHMHLFKFLCVEEGLCI